MNKQEFLVLLDDLVGLPTGTLMGPESLDYVPGWDSMSILSFIALVDQKLGVSLPMGALTRAETVDDLLDLVESQLSGVQG